MNKLLRLIFAASFLMLSCEYKIMATFIIENQSSDIIDSLTMEPTAVKAYKSIKPGTAINFDLDMSNIPRTDGSYKIYWKTDSNKVRKLYDFGYYTNGMPLENGTKIIIQQDTVLVEYGKQEEMAY